MKKAIAGIEVRSSAFLIDKYEEAMQVKTQKFTQMALQTRDKILTDFLDVLERTSIYEEGGIWNSSARNRCWFLFQS